MSSAQAHAPSPELIGPGAFVAVMGPSGSGKDTLIAYARERLDPDMVVFARRIITRPCDGNTEEHDTLTDAAFAAAEAAGAFALSWPAHGLFYGLPKSLDRAIEGGKVVVANVSRAALPALCARYGKVVAVHIGAAPEILAARIAARGRESGDAVLARLARQPAVASDDPEAVRIDNGGRVEVAGDALVAAIRASFEARRI